MYIPLLLLLLLCFSSQKIEVGIFVHPSECAGLGLKMSNKIERSFSIFMVFSEYLNFSLLFHFSFIKLSTYQQIHSDDQKNYVTQIERGKAAKLQVSM